MLYTLDADALAYYFILKKIGNFEVEYSMFTNAFIAHVWYAYASDGVSMEMNVVGTSSQTPQEAIRKAFLYYATARSVVVETKGSTERKRYRYVDGGYFEEIQLDVNHS
jgi:hypothetical protein